MSRYQQDLDDYDQDVAELRRERRAKRRARDEFDDEPDALEVDQEPEPGCTEPPPGAPAL